MRLIRHIIIHCSATPPTMDIGVAEIREWHTAKGWTDVGYHYVIRRNGSVEKGRSDDIVGAHVEGRNKDSIGICLIGGLALGGRQLPDVNYTAPQWSALKTLVGQLTTQYPDARVSGHRNHTTQKTCPNFDAISWWYGQPGTAPAAGSPLLP